MDRPRGGVMNEVLKETEARMVGAVEAFKDELSRLRTGRASLARTRSARVPIRDVATLGFRSPPRRA